jgi:tetratricopeptide (TPR) repeat protein
METLAQKLMTLRERSTGTSVPTAIFGSITTLPQSIINRPVFRIGLWPCMSADAPVETAMGLWLVYASLLERWRDIEVYRLVTRFGETVDEEWQAEQSQFGVDDWQVADLDENIGIWGKLTKTDAGWQLTISIENDLDEASDTETLTVTAPDVSALLRQLPTLAEKTAELIEATQLNEIDPLYIADFVADENFHKFLAQLFHWERYLLAFLWGKVWQESEILAAMASLRAAGKALNNEFAAWAVSKSLERVMLPGFNEVGEFLLDSVDEVVAEFNDSRLPAVILSRALFRAGNTDESYELLKTEVEEHADSALSWLCLGDLYRASGLFVESINAFQSAIENEAVNHAIYHHYGNTLLVAEQYQAEIEEFILIDPDDYEDDFILWEAIEAYDEALALKSDDIKSLYRQCIQLIELDPEYFWEQFEQLVVLDTTGEQVRDVIAAFYLLDDTSPAIAILQEAHASSPSRIDLRLNYAAAMLENEESETALRLLEQAMTLTDDILVQTDIEQLILTAHHPDFEEHFGEVSSIINAGNRPEAAEMDFLEDVVAKAPTFTPGCILMARAYLLWDDNEAALETLLDAQKLLPNDPDILDMLAEQLWTAGEREVAFDYLNRGLQNHPNHVPLLVRTGRYLFDNGQYEDARLYLSRAEVIAPRDPALAETRKYIADKVAEEEVFEDDESDEDDTPKP